MAARPSSVVLEADGTQFLFCNHRRHGFKITTSEMHKLLKDVVGGDDDAVGEEGLLDGGIVDGPGASPEAEGLGFGDPGGVRLVVTIVIVDATYAGVLELLGGEVGIEVGGDGAEALVDEF